MFEVLNMHNYTDLFEARIYNSFSNSAFALKLKYVKGFLKKNVSIL